MEIVSIAYNNKNQTELRIICADGSTTFVPWPCHTWHRDIIEAWLQQPGNTIQPWVDPVNWMNMVRQIRNEKLAAIDWRVIRHITQVNNNETPIDDVQKMSEIYAYMKALRDFPENNPNVTSEEDFNALIWPNEPE